MTSEVVEMCYMYVRAKVSFGCVDDGRVAG